MKNYCDDYNPEEIKKVILAICEMVKGEREQEEYLVTLSRAIGCMETTLELDLFGTLMMDMDFVSRLTNCLLEEF